MGPLFLRGQELQTARMQGMGGVTSFVSGQDAIWANPAGLSTSDNWHLTSVFERRFLLTDLNHLGFGGSVSTQSSHFGFSIAQFGMEEFKRQELGFNYARSLHQKLSVGIALNYLQTRIDEYGNEAALGYELGFQSKIIDELLIGTHLVNPIPTSYSDDEDLSSIFRFGAAYIPSQKALVGFEIEKDVDFPLRLKAGIEYSASSSITIRTGYSSEPSQFHLGLGLIVGENLLLDSSMRYHTILGWTPTFGLSYVPKKS